MIEIVAVVLAIVIVFPFVVYLSVKLGTYAFFRGREIFEESRNGKK